MGKELSDVAVAVTYNPDNDEFLLLKRKDGRRKFPGYWEFPSGLIEDDEDAKNAAIRELEEETGLLGTVLKTSEGFRVDNSEYGSFMVHPVLV
ncbi:MAG: NUDIX hydrolase, partial [Candidatus Nanohaloarchaea archaeon]